MDLLAYLLFVPACFALNMAPGPNNLMALNNARQHGIVIAMIAGFGRISAFVVMIALAASGLAVVLQTSQLLFFVIKTLGALYLFWIAIKLWRTDTVSVSGSSSTQSQGELAKQEFILAIGNPKAILIFTAFLPQFVDVTTAVAPQFIVLGSTFLLLELVAIFIYASLGRYLQHWFVKPVMAKRFNRGCASILALSGGTILFGKSS